MSASAAGPIRASAPGKLLLAGEYAVLSGTEALVLAVDRRAQAVVSTEVGTRSPFLAAVVEVIADELGSESAEAMAAARITVDTSALYHDGTKLGLGSSAAATAAAVTAALAVGSTPPTAAAVERLALRAHRRAQERLGAVGSGADVVASVRGGVCAVRFDPTGTTHCRALAVPPGLTWVGVFAGSSADSRALVAGVQSFALRQPDAHRRCLDAIAAACATLTEALEAGDLPGLLAATETAGRATRELGLAAGVPLWTPEIDRIVAAARLHGGAAKSTGAGAGDTVFAAFENTDDAREFCRACEADGMLVPSLSVDSNGANWQSGADQAPREVV